MNQSVIRFGPAGNATSFSEQGYSSSLDAPAWLAGMGLTAYEYQAGHGVRISEATAKKLGEKAREHGIQLSLHAPYYISLSSTEKQKRTNSIRYILQAAKAAHYMGADRIIVHAGSCGKIGREEALALAMETVTQALAALDEEDLGHIHMCPELMGKINQLGTLDEILALCSLDPRLIPCVDFGHLNARTLGGLKDYADYEEVLDKLETSLGRERAQSIHIHFSRIEFTENGGERRHLTLADTQYGPEFPLLAKALVKRGATPTIICESAGTQAEDALAMQNMYTEIEQEATR